MTEGKHVRLSRRAAVMASAALASSGCSLLFRSTEDAAPLTPAGPLLREPHARLSRELGSSSSISTGGSSTGPFRHIFFCGVGPSTAAALFPDEFDPRTSSYSSLRKGPRPTKDDLLMAGYANAETGCARDRPELNGRILYFSGKMMFFNSEVADTQGGPRPLDAKKLPDACQSLKGEGACHHLQGTVASQIPELEIPGRRFNYLPPSDRAYVLGPHEDSSRSIRISVAASHWMHAGMESMRWMWDPAKKPVNTGEHFAVFLASNCIKFRDEAVKRIAQLGEVHVGDNWVRNACERLAPNPTMGRRPKISPQPDHTPRSSYGENSRVMSKYKFAVVMENTYREGYVTEKIMNAFKSGAVPIWYGGRDYALDIFNPEAFVYYDVEDPKPALRRINHLLSNPDAYRAVLKAPILRDGNRTVEEYFSLRDDVGGGRLKNRIRRMIGMDEEMGASEVKHASVS